MATPTPHLNASLSEGAPGKAAELSTEAAHLSLRSGETQRSAFAAGAVNLLLSAIQVAVGVFTNSQGLIADGFHSLADVIGEVVVISAARAARHPADADHPYGHQRFENAASVVLSALLIGAALGVAWHSLSLLQTGYGVSAVKPFALYVAILGLIAKELLFRYLLRSAHRIGSSVLEADAWHARSDVLSSIVVVIGIFGNLAGFTILDPLAAIVVAVMLLRMGWSFGQKAFDALTDRAPDEATTKAIRHTLRKQPGVIAVHELRVRRSGDQLIGDAHIQVAARVSVSEGHQIAESAARAMRDQHHLSDFLVHIDAENDDLAHQHGGAPTRSEILLKVRSLLPDGLEVLDTSPLHFLDGKVEADLLVLQHDANSGATAVYGERIRQLVTTTPWLLRASVFVRTEGPTS